MDLTLQIKQDGISKGMCQEFQNLLTEGLSIQRLSTLFFKGINFCISSDFPTLPFLRENIGNKGEEYGFYLDNRHIMEINRQKLVLNGECRARIQYQNCNVGKMYIRHNSSAQVFVSGCSTVAIDAFDDTHLNIIVAGKDSQVLVSLYGNATCSFVGQGVKVTHKNKTTY